LNDDVKDLFKKYEFNSIYSEEKKLKTWKHLNLKVEIIKNDKDLEELKNIILKFDKVFFDTETTSLDFTQAELV
jgi:hypothetical protein